MNSTEATPTLEAMARQLEHEHDARIRAEIMLENKSRELSQIDQTLRESNAALHEQLKRSAAVLRHAAEGILTFDVDGVVDSFNPAAERIFDYPAQDAIGLDYRVLFRGPTPPNASFSDWAAVLVGCRHTSQTANAMGVRRDGTRFPVDVVASLVELDERELVTAIVRDVTESRELERQLAHAQKMESIGQLAAGIAHEINTPIQYVGDNCRFLQDAFANLDTLIKLYSELEHTIPVGAANQAIWADVRQLANRINLDFLRAEIPTAIAQSIDGTERVAQIVRAMKDFSHPGGEEKTAVSLNAAVTSTITVCRNEWKYVATIKTELDENLPQLICLPGEINQAILNVVVNAAHAIKERLGDNSAEMGLITIKTLLNGQWIELRISDTGTGIPDAIRDKIFDPFFTTKGVGRGTGQGLAMTYATVVEKHDGEIKVETEPGKGTTFVIRLPLRPKTVASVQGAES